jgi:hypothetical protein
MGWDVDTLIKNFVNKMRTINISNYLNFQSRLSAFDIRSIFHNSISKSELLYRVNILLLSFTFRFDSFRGKSFLIRYREYDDVT